jgi:hypothetical protein
MEQKAHGVLFFTSIYIYIYIYKHSRDRNSLRSKSMKHKRVRGMKTSLVFSSACMQAREQEKYN